MKGSLFIIDIDNFKELNDTFGHQMGDSAIIELAETLRQVFRAEDIIGRIGGDEFMVFSPGLTSKQSIDTKLNEILERCNLHYEYNKLNADISVSIGVYAMKNSTTTFQELYEKADTALYISKRNGKNMYHVYTDKKSSNSKSASREMQSHHTMLKQLQSAINDNRLVVHYQPIYHVPTGTFTKAEALVRIVKEDGTLIYPNNFVSVADSSSVGVEMTYIILEQICSDFRKLLDSQPNTSLKAISINIPYLQFTDANIEERFVQILGRHNIEPKQIKIEITERILIKDLDLMLNKIASMQTMGFDVELDDFGTDYSNLQMCIELPIKTIKRDRSILLASFNSSAGKNFFRHIIKGIHETRRQTVLEGVETLAQLNWAKRCKCEYIQGYYFSKPLDFQTFASFLSK